MASFWTWRKVSEDTAGPEFIMIANQRLARLGSALSELIGLVQAVDTIPSGATAPTVAGAKLWKVQNPAPTSITTFSDGQSGTEFLLWATTANTTIVHSAAVGGIYLKGAANVTLGANETRRFATIDGISWRET